MGPPCCGGYPCTVRCTQSKLQHQNSSFQAGVQPRARLGPVEYACGVPESCTPFRMHRSLLSRPVMSPFTTAEGRQRGTSCQCKCPKGCMCYPWSLISWAAREVRLPCWARRPASGPEELPQACQGTAAAAAAAAGRRKAAWEAGGQDPSGHRAPPLAGALAWAACPAASCQACPAAPDLCSGEQPCPVERRTAGSWNSRE